MMVLDVIIYLALFNVELVDNMYIKRDNDSKEYT